MDSIRIDTGVKRLSINDDPKRVIEFNPYDVIFAEKFYALIADFEAKLAEYQERIAAVETVDETDEHGLPLNAGERIAIHKEVCEYVRERIDHLFGEGTSQTAFGDVLNMDVYAQFFEGVTPFIKGARARRIAKYAAPKAKAKARRK
jgi:hypothetical protein